MSVKWSWCSNLNRLDLFLYNALYVAWRRKAEHSVTLRRFPPLCTRLLFAVNTLTVFLSFCYICKDFVRQLKAFPLSFCHFCACEMSPGWGHLITWMDPSVGHLNGILARVGGNLNDNFQKKSNARGVARGEGACWSFDLTDALYMEGLIFGIYGSLVLYFVRCCKFLITSPAQLLVKLTFKTDRYMMDFVPSAYFLSLWSAHLFQSFFYQSHLNCIFLAKTNHRCQQLFGRIPPKIYT